MAASALRREMPGDEILQIGAARRQAGGVDDQRAVAMGGDVVAIDPLAIALAAHRCPPPSGEGRQQVATRRRKAASEKKSRPAGTAFGSSSAARMAASSAAGSSGSTSRPSGAVARRVAAAVAAAGDRRHAAGHRLEQHDAEALAAARHGVDVGQPVVRRLLGLVDAAGEDDMAVERRRSPASPSSRARSGPSPAIR